jgi:hypothetical protein
MRNCLAFLFVLAITAGAAVAQKSEFEFILRPAFGSVWGALPDRHNMHGDKFVFTTGLGFGRRINTKSSIHVSLLTNPRTLLGEGELYNTDPVTGETQVYNTSSYLSLSYLTLPLEYRRRFGNKIIFEYGAGVYVGYLLNYGNGYDIPPDFVWSVGVTKSNDFDFINLKKGDFGLAASFRASYPIKERVFIYVAIDEYLGLLNINKMGPPTGGTSVPTDYTVRNNSFGISFGLSFQL